MPNIKEIALRFGLEIFDESPYDAGHVVDSGNKWIDDKLIEFAEALVAELAKGNEPVYQFRPECDNWIDCSPVFFESWRGEKRIVYHLPPTASQIEQETAEAIAKMLDSNPLDRPAAQKIRSGAWKEFK